MGNFNKELEMDINGIESDFSKKLKQVSKSKEAQETEINIKADANDKDKLTKNKIISCGYHGWHDWNAISLKKNGGIPKFN